MQAHSVLGALGGLLESMKSVFWLTVWQNNVCLEPQRLWAAPLTKERIELTRRLRRP